jgi:hypothetical protein
METTALFVPGRSGYAPAIVETGLGLKPLRQGWYFVRDCTSREAWHKESDGNG